jgi:hypothetical protein
MSEENTEISATETPSASTAETVVHSTEARDKPAGYDPVDPSNSTPEQVQERLNYLYGQVKHSDREKKEMRSVLAEQSRLLSELTAGQQAVVSHLQDRSITETESSLKSQMQSAWEKGDNNTYFALQDKLDDLRIEKKLAAKSKSEPQSQQSKGAIDYAQQAQGTGELSQEEFNATNAWQSEKDENGNLVRPWAFGSDPNHRAALEEARAVFNNPRFANLPFDKKLEEVDKRMGTQKRTGGQNVMGGNLTTPSKQGKLTLTPKQQEIAIKTKYAGSGKTDAEHLEAYRKQVQNIKQRRQ